MKTYDPNQHDVIFGGNLLSGWGPGTFLNISSEGPRFTDQVGVDGKTVRERRADRRATITFTFMQTSEANEIMTNLMNADSFANGGPTDFRMVDRSGTTVFEANKAWIMNDPDVTLDATATTREWVVRVERLSGTHGSNPDQ